MTLARLAESQIDAPASEQRMLAIGKGRNAMKEKPRRPAPHDDVAMQQPTPLRLVAAHWPTEQEDRRQSQRHRDDRCVEILLVPVLVQRHASASFVAVDQAGI